jgi:type I restriction enzyme S subunit
MEVRPGYQQTDLGIIPEDWLVRSLDQLGEALIGLTYKPSDVREDGTLVLRASNIQNGTLAFDDNVYVDCPIPERLKVQPGDVLICVRNGSRQLIGKTVLLDERTVGMTFGAFMAVYRSPMGRLVSYLFQSDILRRQIKEQLGATINQITNSSLNSFRIPVPRHDSEQRAIGAALGDVDALLSGLDRLIAKKRDLKQAALQQLLTGQTRLPGFSQDWELKRLGELGTFLKGSGVKKDEANSGDLPCIRYGEIYTHHCDYVRVFNSRISADVAAKSTRIRQGDLLFAGSGETKEDIGKCVAFIDDHEAYAGGDIVILRLADANPMFMGYYCNAPHINAQKASKAQGDAVVHISPAALGGLELAIPSLPEQTAIATVLADMDTELAALEARRDKTGSLKEAMMQELLTGKIRLVHAQAGHA